MSPGSRCVSGELVRAYASAHAAAEVEIVAHSLQGRSLLQEVDKLAPSFRAALICGETGTGKTVLARRLHARAGRDDLRSPLRVVNCAALSDALLVDLLWQPDGASARADEPSASTLRSPCAEPTASTLRSPCEEPTASSHTILLDEVGELSPWGQAVLLRKLQNEPLSSSARFIAATHRNLDLMAARGTFSRELLFRLCIARIVVTPLRARRDDVVPLALHFLRLALRASGTRFISVDADLYQCLERYDWPGNVRELKNAISNALAVNESGTLCVEDLPDAVRAARETSLRWQ